MSLLIRYKFDDPSDLTKDASGNAHHLLNMGGVASLNDPTHGTVAHFDGGSTSYLFLDQSDRPDELDRNHQRTASVWLKNIKPDISLTWSYIYSNGVSETNNNAEWARISETGVDATIGSSNKTIKAPYSLLVDVWYHLVFTFDDTRNQILYINGAVIGEKELGLAGVSGPLVIGANNFYLHALAHVDSSFYGQLSDFRFYDDALSPAEVSTLYSQGPNPTILTVSMYTHIADLEWTPVSGVETYRVIIESGANVVMATTSGTTYTSLDLTPDTAYVFSVYTSTDLLDPVYTSTESTPSVDVTSSESLLSRIGNDLTLLNSTSLGDIQAYIPQVLSTGDIVTTSVGETVYVRDAETANITTYPMLTPFDTSSGTGQSFSILLPDQNTELLEYDETSDHIISNGAAYSHGDQFALGTFKVRVKSST